jgi:hypothetical protein
VGNNGRVIANTSISASSDLEALTVAETMADEHAAGLWDDMRFSEGFKPNSPRFEVAF